jgi:hypothetical protein
MSNTQALAVKAEFAFAESVFERPGNRWQWLR